MPEIIHSQNSLLKDVRYDFDFGRKKWQKGELRGQEKHSRINKQDEE